MQARPVAGDEPGDPVRYAVQVHVLMSQAERELWARVADCCRLAVDDVVHAAAVSWLKQQRTQAGDVGGMHVAEVCERELLARLGRTSVAPERSGAEWIEEAGVGPSVYGAGPGRTEREGRHCTE